MSAVKVIPDIYCVGTVDWNIRNFHGHTYTTKRGTTYNAYLILDEKVALVDTVDGHFANELVDNIKSIISPEKIDYIIVIYFVDVYLQFIHVYDLDWYGLVSFQ